MSATAASPLQPATSPPLEPGIVIASLGRIAPPLEIDRFGGPPHGTTPARPSGEMDFRFCYYEVPFHGRTSRRDGRPVLTLTGDLGPLPFTIESARRRRRLLRVLQAAQYGSGFEWRVAAEQRIQVSGMVDLDVDLGMPLTPIAVIAAAAALLMACRPYLELAVAVVGEA